MTYQAMKKYGGMNLKCINWEASNWKGLHANCVTFWKRQNYGDNKKIQWFPGVQRWRRDEQAEYRGFFRAVKYSIYHHNDGKMSYTFYIYIYIHLSKHTKCTAPRMNPSVNHGLYRWLWCVLMGFSLVTSVPFWWAMLIMGDACVG